MDDPDSWRKQDNGHAEFNECESGEPNFHNTREDDLYPDTYTMDKVSLMKVMIEEVRADRKSPGETVEYGGGDVKTIRTGDEYIEEYTFDEEEKR